MSKSTDCTKELAKDEIWLGNTDVRQGLKVPDYCKNLKTIRLGEQAFCIEGTKLSPEYMRPLIVNKSEAQAYDNIMMQRVKDARRNYR